VYQPERCHDRELPDGVDDTQPNRHAGKIAIRREFFSSFGAFRRSLVAVAREHQVGYPPNVDFRYHAERLRGGTSIYGYGVRCSPAPIRGAGSSSRTGNTPPTVSTFAPTHHRATKAPASAASRK